jgi:CheY-like chemotaxis protein
LDQELNVLFVGRDAAYCDAMGDSLQVHGCHVRLRRVLLEAEAISYLGGLGVYENREHFPVPDLLLLDTRIGERSGLVLLDWRAANKDAGMIPVVILIKKMSYDEVQIFFDRGANCYLAARESWSKLFPVLDGLTELKALKKRLEQRIPPADRRVQNQLQARR